MTAHIPTQVHLAILDRTIDIHWNYHAWLMIGLWFVLAPAAFIAIRFFKPKPTPFGIEKDIGRLDPRIAWWTIHYVTLYTVILLSLAGGALALTVSRGLSGSLHSFFGLATIGSGCLQIVSAWFRGSHGGKYGAHSDPADPSTWHGDHYDMTAQRRWFEAYHKTAGYFTILMAFGAVATGLAQYWMPSIGLALGILTPFFLLLAVVLEGKGLRHDTYRSVYGNHPDHPYNRARKGL